MKKYSVSLVLTVEAENPDEALDYFEDRISHSDYDSDSIKIEEEE